MAAKKVKLSDVARDLHIPTQELITFFMERDANGVKKKGVTGLTTEEINLALEYYSQKSQVENFDRYFATKSAPKQKQDKKPQSGEKKQPEKKNGDRKPAERRNGGAPQGGKKPVAPAAQPEKKPAEEKKPAARKPKQPHQAPKAQNRGERLHVEVEMASADSVTTEKRRTVDTLSLIHI